MIIPALSLTWKMLMCTCRYEIRNKERWDDLTSNNDHVIIASHHESLAFACWQYRNSGFHTLTSYSYDGEIAARIVNSLGMEALRGSSSRGGARAIVQMQRAMKLVSVFGITLDGPKGPRRIAKPGVAILSVRTGVPIIPNAYAVRPAWHLRSWDEMPVPKPFAKVICAYGEPIYPPEERTPEAIETLRQKVEGELNRLYSEIEL